MESPSKSAHGSLAGRHREYWWYCQVACGRSTTGRELTGDQHVLEVFGCWRCSGCDVGARLPSLPRGARCGARRGVVEKKVLVHVTAPHLSDVTQGKAAVTSVKAGKANTATAMSHRPHQRIAQRRALSGTHTLTRSERVSETRMETRKPPRHVSAPAASRPPPPLRGRFSLTSARNEEQFFRTSRNGCSGRFCS